MRAWPQSRVTRQRLAKGFHLSRGKEDRRHLPASHGHNEELHALRLDGSRIRDTDEARVPVITPDGPGLLR
ncbi:DUF6210 family protein [Kitasatospora sp. NPDC048343]|uniref:DUF6210 family protein n=1 Tax=Kitasatospora sp. NPDC048343 TaxID=3154717 RepID=UPI003409E5C5